jgi:hypothetical protein
MLYRLENRLGGLRHDAAASAGILLAFAVAASLVGYVISWGQPVPILLALGAVIGIALLNALPMVLAMILAGVLLINGPVTMFVPELQKLGWLFSLLGFFLTGAAMLYPAVGRPRFERTVPFFVVLAIVIWAYAMLSMAYSAGPPDEGIRAAKRFFQFFGLLFILAVVPFPHRLIKKYFGFLVLLAAVQLPFAIYQRLVLVPLREGMPRVYPLDIVVGTMEGSIKGGGSSGVLALLLVFILAFAIAAYREGVLPLRWFLPLVIANVASLALGEVNVIILFIPLALAAIFLETIRRRPFKFIMLAFLALPVLFFLGWLYLVVQAQDGQTLQSKLDEIIGYNFGTRGYFVTGLNRVTVYPYWMDHNSLADPIRFFFGHGLGSSFGGMDEPNPGHMDRAHMNMFIGLTAAAAILWDLGVVGLVLFLALFLSAARHAYLLTKVAAPGFDRAFCQSLFAMALMLTVMLFYSQEPITVLSQQVLAYIALGMIAWRWRMQ